ncbi:eukaryotic long-chain fatty acid CoA synthetase (LC-FACS) [Dipodascopsis tothii]|uniref:eukaryotic long-chain fatty acid CoA synthetase (LC-FACS) n=1 Tax=Dipodascopsis tothii TaxID=44089 RepID=UPI0034CE2686
MFPFSSPTVIKADEFHPAVTRASPPYSMDSPDATPVSGETVPRRNTKAINGLVKTPHPDIATAYDIVRYAAKTFGSKQCLGSRKLVDTHDETKLVKKMVDGKEVNVPKKWTYFELSPYSYISYSELLEQVNHIGSGLAHYGLDSSKILQLYASTSANWLATALGASSQSIPISTAYDTLGEEGLTHSLNETEAFAVFTDASLLPSLVRPLKSVPKLQMIIYRETPAEGALEKLATEFPNIKLVSFDDLVSAGKANPAEPIPPKADDLCCIMYTSGSTGTPKGVVLTHRNVVASVAGTNGAVGDVVTKDDYLLTYLPLAHILEFVFELSCLFWGGTLGYGTVRTISDLSVRNCRGDIAEFRPTVMVGVPAVWESVRKGIVNKVQAAGSVTSKVFWGAFKAKQALQSMRLPGASLLDSIVFKKVKEATGGRLRIVMNGGAPLSVETQMFITTVIAPMIIGYGLTETAAMCCLMAPSRLAMGVAGDPMVCVEIKLVDVPENGYLSTNNPPQGEVLVRGDCVSSQYYKNERETKDAYTEDGWFRTGDIGEWAPSGHLRLIDRKKNLVKTLNGEYIALEKLESLYRTSRLVQNICVYADSNHVKPIAMVQPVEAALVNLAKEMKIEKSFGALVHDEAIQKAVLNQLLDAGKKGGLAGIELICGVVLSDEEWTAQNGLLTAAQKLQRKKILEEHKARVDALYKSVD